MARKSKQAGSGHLPLTNYERKEYGKAYGQGTKRLSGASQTTFGHCALSLHPAKDEPVATPSGYIYERHAILEYLLHQTQQLKQAQQRYDQWVESQKAEQVQAEQRKRRLEIEKFEEAQKIIPKKQKVEEENPLKRSSFWLADFQPNATDKKKKESADSAATGAIDEPGMEPPPKRPQSPMSQKPLRRKDLIPLEIQRNKDEQVICAISQKSIVTQPALALITKPDRPAHVVLEQVYKELGSEKVCPVTGLKISKILQLQKGASSFAASGGAAVDTAGSHGPTML